VSEHTCWKSTDSNVMLRTTSIIRQKAATSSTSKININCKNDSSLKSASPSQNFGQNHFEHRRQYSSNTQTDRTNVRSDPLDIRCKSVTGAYEGRLKTRTAKSAWIIASCLFSLVVLSFVNPCGAWSLEPALQNNVGGSGGERGGPAWPSTYTLRHHAPRKMAPIGSESSAGNNHVPLGKRQLMSHMIARVMKRSGPGRSELQQLHEPELGPLLKILASKLASRNYPTYQNV